MKVAVKFIRSNEVNDIYEVTHEDGKIGYIKFPSTMGMTAKDIEEDLND